MMLKRIIDTDLNAVKATEKKGRLSNLPIVSGDIYTWCGKELGYA